MGFWNELKPGLWCLKNVVEKEAGWRCGAGFLIDRAREQGTAYHMEREGDIQVFVHHKPLNLKQWKGRHLRRTETEQGSITIKLTARKSALAETGLSLQISMNWKRETA